MTKTPKPQVLTLKGVKAAARKALAQGRLMAQHRDKTKRRCIYDGGDGRGCAIGVALNKKTLAAVELYGIAEKYVHSLKERGIVSMSDDDYSAIRGIQSRHDEWANYARESGGNAESTRRAKKAFLAAIAA